MVEFKISRGVNKDFNGRCVMRLSSLVVFIGQFSLLCVVLKAFPNIVNEMVTNTFQTIFEIKQLL
jgi:hypothetical protein